MFAHSPTKMCGHRFREPLTPLPLPVNVWPRIRQTVRGHLDMKPLRAVFALVIASTLGACAAGPSRDMGTTDAFLRSALDAYGVIDVVPTSRAVAEAPAGAPLDATTGANRRASGAMTLTEACQGKTGIQPGLLDATTRQPIDCGSGAGV